MDKVFHFALLIAVAILATVVDFLLPKDDAASHIFLIVFMIVYLAMWGYVGEKL